MEKVKVIISDRQHKFKVPTGIRMLIRRCCAERNAPLSIGGQVEVLSADAAGSTFRYEGQEYTLGNLRGPHQVHNAVAVLEKV